MLIHDQLIDVIADAFDIGVLVNHFDGLWAQCGPDQSARLANRAHRFINLRQPFVILAVGRQERVRVDGRPELGQHTKGGCKLIALLVVRQALLSGHDAVEAFQATVHIREKGQALFQLFR